jgi:hypothetical protein
VNPVSFLFPIYCRFQYRILREEKNDALVEHIE